ncbi:shikimate kinase [Pacificimonas flava]|nr:shikimate kinase [Pacificimonas flava]MBB5279273.1 shikimate kinase [Pacificimonas flava]
MATKPKIPKPPAPPRNAPIMLVGLMGAGKSTIGRRLARRLSLPFVDADEEIEAAAGLSVSEIFARFGEAHFRDGERRVIARLMEGRRQVIATGGGAFVDDETRAAMLASGITIWVDADIEVLIERVSRRDTRPLLAGQDRGAVMRALAKARAPRYAEAHFHVMSSPAPPQEAVEAIIAELTNADLL